MPRICRCGCRRFIKRKSSEGAARVIWGIATGGASELINSTQWECYDCGRKYEKSLDRYIEVS